MVRPDETEDKGTPEVRGARKAVSRSTTPTGVSPVPVGNGAPVSRPQSDVERRPATAGRQKPALSREQARGPQHEVKPAASTYKQWECRAEHVAAKARSTTGSNFGSSVLELSGVRGAARVQGEVGNRRDPSGLPSSRQGVPYKPKVKAGTVGGHA